MYAKKSLGFNPEKILAKLDEFIPDDEEVLALFQFWRGEEYQLIKKQIWIAIISRERMAFFNTYPEVKMEVSVPMSEIKALLPEVSKKRMIYSIQLKNSSTIPFGEFMFGEEEQLIKIISECMANPIKSKRAVLDTPEIRESKRMELRESKQIELKEIESNFPWNKTPEHLRENLILNIGAGEKPLFIISASAGDSAGSLVAMSDRCLLIKSGLMGSFMADTLGGARVATFYYRDITGIEYNSGFFNGVLEILTASYQGTANKDYWKMGSRNEDANDPWTLSNTLPLGKTHYESAQELMDKLRKLISASKNGVSPSQSIQPQSVADEIKKLAKLLKEGLIDESEYKDAKKRLLG
jgi:hypothetical protein